MWVVARANKIPMVAALSVAGGVVLAAYADVSVEFPLGRRRFPLALFLPILIGILHGYALIDWWQWFTRSALRYGYVFRLALVMALGSTSLLAAAPTLVSLSSLQLFANVLIILSFTQLSVVLMGEFYWVAVAVAGFVLLYFFLSTGELAQAVNRTVANGPGLALTASALFLTATMYVKFGARGHTHGEEDI